MDLILRAGFESVTHSINFNPQTIIKGKALALSYVQRVEELRGKTKSDITLIRCSVIRQTSVTLHPYKVQLELNADRHVSEVACTCVSEAAKKCKHICALIQYINLDRSSSKTTIKQEWGKPSDAQLGKEMYSKPLIITDVFKTNDRDGDTSDDRIEPYYIQYSDLVNIPCPLRMILKEEALSESHIDVRNIINDLLTLTIKQSCDSTCEIIAQNLIDFANDNESYSGCEDISNTELRRFYDETITLSESKIAQLCVLTIAQSESPEWFSARNSRISASSKAHAIKSQTKKHCDTLAGEFANPRDKNNNIPSLVYGRKYEKQAISEYTKNFENSVENIGLFVHPRQPWLCASADGIVIEDLCITKVLEIKCPSSCQSKPVFDKDTQTCNVPYFYLHNGNIELKEGHKYYTQCQMTMYVLGLTECDFYVWSPKGSCLTRVRRNESFLSTLVPKLTDFYFKYYLQALFIKNRERRNAI